MPAKRRSLTRRFRWLLFPTMVLIWFLAVDLSVFVENCPDCGYSRDVTALRFLGIPVYTKKVEYPSLLELVARDLGYPCPHPQYSSFHKFRFWGLCVCGCPCIGGIDHISPGPGFEMYPASLEAKIKAIAATRPSVGEELRERVVYHHDFDYWREFLKPCEPLRPETMTQPE